MAAGVATMRICELEMEMEVEVEVPTLSLDDLDDILEILRPMSCGASASSASVCLSPDAASTDGSSTRHNSSSSSGTGGGTGGGTTGTAGKMCLVCGDRALSCNFGAVTCESCKAFFRRNALKEMWGKCDGKCPVAVETRSYCKKCRLEKCFSVGMKKDLILNDSQKQERRQKILENRMRRQGLTTLAQNHMAGGGMGGTGIYDDRSESPDGIDPRLGYVTRHTVDEIVMVPTMMGGGMVAAAGQSLADSTGVNLSNHSRVQSITPPSLQTPPLQSTPPLPWPGHQSLPPPSSSSSSSSSPYLNSTKMSSVGHNSYYNHHSVGTDGSRASPRSYASVVSSSPPSSLSPLDVSSHGTASPNATTTSEYSPQVVPQPLVSPVDTKMYMPKPHKTAEGKKMGLESTPPPSDASDIAEGQTDLSPVPSSKVTHSLSQVNMDDLLDKMEMEKLVLFLEVKKGFSITFDQPVDDPIDPAPSYTEFFNLAELPIKRLVKLAKSLSPFHQLCQNDQIALLKGSVVAVVTIRSAKLFNPSNMGWNVTRGGKNMDLSSISLLTSNPDGAKFFQHYVTFVKNLVTVSKSDDGIMMLLIVLSVFDPNLENIDEKDAVQGIRNQYTDVLQQYIEIKYPNCKAMFEEVISQLDRIVEIRNMHSQALQKTPPSKLEPLIMEIFDVTAGKYPAKK